jgi:hypothetical protein
MNYSLTERHVETGRPNKSKEENGTGKVQKKQDTHWKKVKTKKNRNTEEVCEKYE